MISENKKNKCPYCKNSMIIGAIHRDRYALKWIPDEYNRSILSGVFRKGIILDGGMSGKGFVEAQYCKKCNKIIIDIEESSE